MLRKRGVPSQTGLRTLTRGCHAEREGRSENRNRQVQRAICNRKMEPKNAITKHNSAKRNIAKRNIAKRNIAKRNIAKCNIAKSNRKMQSQNEITELKCKTQTQNPVAKCNRKMPSKNAIATYSILI